MNTADRPFQVGSLYHFADSNGALVFDRAAAHQNATRAGPADSTGGSVDCVMTIALTLDHWAIVKAGNPDTPPEVDIIIGHRHRDHQLRRQYRHCNPR